MEKTQITKDFEAKKKLWDECPTKAHFVEDDTNAKMKDKPIDEATFADLGYYKGIKINRDPEKEKPLSEKVIEEGYYLRIEDVKEAVEKLKELQSIIMNNTDYTEDDLMLAIDTIFGVFE